MIGLPGYIGPQAGPTFGRTISDQEADYLIQAQQYDPVLAQKQKLDAEKSMRSSELFDIARQLEYMRHRLLVLDLHDGAACLDQVIRDLVLRWDMERHPDAV